MTGTFGSLITAMVTPFRDDHAVDYGGAQELASYLLDHGSDGVVVAGSTGESPTLTDDERTDPATLSSELSETLGEALAAKVELPLARSG